MEQLDCEKCKWEEKVLGKLQEQITNDKASKYLGKLLRDMRTKNRDMVNVYFDENLNGHEDIIFRKSVWLLLKIKVQK